MIELVDKLNKELGDKGLLPIELVNPRDLKPQIKNARYMMPEKFKTLVKNIEKTGNLESVPLVIKKDNKYEIVSGHHRIEAAIEANLKEIVVLLLPKETTLDEKTSKQLSHNSLSGLDDEMILAELFNSIKTIELKIASGLNDKIAKINYDTLNFKVGEYKEFTVLFMKEDEKYTDDIMNKIVNEMSIKSKSAIRLTNINYWDKFAKIIRKIKKSENVKSNGTAFVRMLELAEISLNIEMHKVHN